MLIDIYLKFDEDISNSFPVTERIWSKGNT